MKNRKVKTDRQIYIKFVVMVALGIVLGGIIGGGGAIITNQFGGDIAAGLNQIFKVCIPVIYIILMIVAYTISFTNYGKAQKMIKEWNGENEAVLGEADRRLGLALEPSSIMMMCNFFFYSAMTYISGLKIPGVDKTALKAGIPIMIAGLLLFLFNMVIITVIQKLVIDLTKKINPEKRGNVFDTEFNKEWLASCDEAQKQAVFEAGYRAYQTASYGCMIMWIITFVAMILFDTGIFPSICVFVIYLTLVLSYTIACHKIEKKK